MSNFDKVRAIIEIIFINNELPLEKEIGLETSMKNDLHMDSIMLAEFSVRMEDEFGMDVFQNGLVYKVSEIVDMVTQPQ